MINMLASAVAAAAVVAVIVAETVVFVIGEWKVGIAKAESE